MAIKSLDELQALCNANAAAIRAKKKYQEQMRPTQFPSALRYVPMGNKTIGIDKDGYTIQSGEDISLVSNDDERNFYLFQFYSSDDDFDYMQLQVNFSVTVEFANSATPRTISSVPFAMEQGEISDTIALVLAYYVNDNLNVDIVKANGSVIALTGVSMVSATMGTGYSESQYLNISSLLVTGGIWNKMPPNSDALTNWRNQYITAVKSKLDIPDSTPVNIEDVASLLNNSPTKKISQSLKENFRIEAGETAQLPIATQQSVAVFVLLNYDHYDLDYHRSFLNLSIVSSNSTESFYSGSSFYQEVDENGDTVPVGYLSFVGENGIPVVYVFLAANGNWYEVTQYIPNAQTASISLIGSSSDSVSWEEWTIELENL